MAKIVSLNKKTLDYIINGIMYSIVVFEGAIKEGRAGQFSQEEIQQKIDEMTADLKKYRGMRNG